eukprot:scaffold6466_cov390-Prasinococcus_capsulatus_cf.AAC.1
MDSAAGREGREDPFLGSHLVARPAPEQGAGRAEADVSWTHRSQKWRAPRPESARAHTGGRWGEGARGAGAHHR